MQGDFSDMWLADFLPTPHYLSEGTNSVVTHVNRKRNSNRNNKRTDSPPCPAAKVMHASYYIRGNN